MPSKLQPCFCDAFKCNGKNIRPQDSSRHLRLDEEKKHLTAIPGHPMNADTLVDEVFRVTLKDNMSTPEFKRGEAIWERESCNPAQGVVVALSTSAGSVPVNQSSQELPNAPAVSENR